MDKSKNRDVITATVDLALKVDNRFRTSPVVAAEIANMVNEVVEDEASTVRRSLGLFFVSPKFVQSTLRA